MGLGFWSLLDAGGQINVPTFPTVDDAKNHIRSWNSNNDPSFYAFSPLSTDDEYADSNTLEEAGLRHIMGELLITNHTIGHG